MSQSQKHLINCTNIEQKGTQMKPGYSAFIGISDAYFCCILFFNSFSPQIEETGDFDDEGELKTRTVIRDSIELLGIAWHPTLEDINDAMNEVIPGAYIQFHTPTPINLHPTTGDLILRPITCPMMALVNSVAATPPTKMRSSRQLPHLRRIALKIAEDMD